jgi:membrane protease YdiL (CAAX protease family)
VLLLCLLFIVVFELIKSIHLSFGDEDFRRFWYYDSPLSLLVVASVGFYQQPRLLALSRWRLGWRDLAAGILLGVLVPVIFWLASPGPAYSLRFHPVAGAAVVPIVIMAPIMEEILLRGMFLQSFMSYLPRAVAVLLVTVLSASGHHNFYIAAPIQFTLSVLYIALGNSLSASIIAHATNNAVVLVLATATFEKWHAYIYSLGGGPR